MARTAVRSASGTLNDHMKNIILLPLLLAVGCVAGCGPADALKAHTGDQCVVHFRGDYLGMASPAPLSPDTDSLNGSDVTLRGTLRSVDIHWLTVDSVGKPSREFVIPREAVLTVSFGHGRNLEP